MKKELSKFLSREQAIFDIVKIFERLKFASTEKYVELAEVILSQAVSLKGLSDATEVSRNKNEALRKTQKVKGASFKALEALRELKKHNLTDLEGHNIEINTKLKMGIGLDEIITFMEAFDESAQKTKNIKSGTLEQTVANYLAQFYYEQTGKIPKADDNEMEPRTPFEHICDSAAKYAGIKIKKGQMKRACKALKEDIQKQGEILKK